MSDRQFMLLLRVILVTFSLAALLFALNSRSTMYEMVQNAYKVTLVSCVVPLAAGVFWKRATTVGAVLSVVFDWCRGPSRSSPPQRPPCHRSSWASRSQSLAWCSARSCRARPLRPRCIRTASAEHPAPRASRLARTLFFVYVLLVAYASLYPFSGWRDVGLSPLAFLNGPWPRYVTAFDITVNVAGYLPFGLLAVLAIYPRLAPTAAALLAVAAAAALSLLLEAAQSYLPARVPTNLDVLCNIGGAARRGASPAFRGPHRRRPAFSSARGRAPAWAGRGLRARSPWALVFRPAEPGGASFRLGRPARSSRALRRRARRPQFFVVIEAATTAANLIAVALILSALVAPGRPVRAMIMLMMLAALSVKTAAVAILMRAENVFTWLTHGAQIGLAVGIAGALAAVALPRTARLVLAAVLLMAATVLVNLAPPNPYLADSLKVWQQGHFLNFNGLTRLVSALWPFIALGYLMVLASRRLK